MRKLFLAVTLILASSISCATNLGRQFVPVKLAYGASVSIPNSWQVLRDNEMRAVETTAGAAIDLSGYSKQIDGVETLIVATFPDPDLYASVTVTSLAAPGVTPALPTFLTDAQVKAGESTIRQGVQAVQSKLGVKVTGWSPMKKIVIGRSTIMYTSYIRSSDAGSRKVHMYKFFGSGRIFDMALSTSVKHEPTNGVILKNIASSFIVP